MRFFVVKVVNLRLLMVMFFLCALFGVLVSVVCEVFSSVEGYDRCLSPSVIESSLYFMMAALPWLYLPRQTSPVSVLLWLLYLMNVLASILLLPFIDVHVSSLEKILFAGLISFTFFVLSKAAQINVPKIAPVRIGGRLFISILLLVNFLAIATLINYVGFSFKLTSIYDVYLVRAEFKDQVAVQGGRVLGYTMLISGYSLAPFSLLMGFHFFRSFRILSIILIFSSVLICFVIYSAAAFKSVVFAPLLSLLVYLVLLSYRENVSGFVAFWLGVFIIGFMLYFAGLHDDIFIHWIRRVFFVPGLNAVYYFEHFGFDSFGYGDQAPLIVSQLYYGTDGSANSGVYGSGLANGGVFGVLVNLALLLAFIFVLKSLTPNGCEVVVAAAIVPFAYALSNSATTTSLVSYGGAVTLALLFLGAKSIKSVKFE